MYILPDNKYREKSYIFSKLVPEAFILYHIRVIT